MKPLESPGYVQKTQRHGPHRVPGFGMCPVCGQFAPAGRTKVEGEFKTQYRYCSCGESHQTVVRLEADRQ